MPQPWCQEQLKCCWCALCHRSVRQLRLLPQKWVVMCQSHDVHFCNVVSLWLMLPQNCTLVLEWSWADRWVFGVTSLSSGLAGLLGLSVLFESRRSCGSWIVRKCFSDTCANIIQTPSVYRSIGSIIQACSLSHRTGMSWKLWLYLGPLLPAALQEGSQARFVCRVCLFFRQWPHRVCLPVSDRWCFSSSTYVWGEGSGNGIQTKGLPKVKKGLLYVVSEVSSCFLLLLFLLLMAFLLCRDFVYVSQDPKDQLLLG